MTFFEKYIEAQNNGDTEALVSLFAADGLFRDFGGRPQGQRRELYAQGTDAMRKMFTKVFAGERPVLTMIKQEKHSMEYTVKMGPLLMECVGCVELNGEGLATEYIVRPR